jgi:hypothetical protein
VKKKKGKKVSNSCCAPMTSPSIVPPLQLSRMTTSGSQSLDRQQMLSARRSTLAAGAKAHQQTVPQAPNSPLARGRSASALLSGMSEVGGDDGPRKLGPTEVSRSADAILPPPTAHLVTALIRAGQYSQLFLFVRQQRTTVAMLQDALGTLGAPALVRALSTKVTQMSETCIVHELVRSSTLQHIFWLVGNTPALLAIAEPKSNMTVLHVCALMHPAADDVAMVRNVWQRVDASLLARRDAANNTVAHYLAMRACFSALAVVRERCLRNRPTANGGDTVDSLAISAMARDLEIERRERTRLTMVAEAAECMASSLQSMHEALDGSITERDDKLKRATVKIRQLSVELRESKQSAARSQTAFIEAVERMRKSEQERLALEQQCADLRAKLEERATTTATTTTAVATTTATFAAVPAAAIDFPPPPPPPNGLLRIPAIALANQTANATFYEQLTRHVAGGQVEPLRRLLELGLSPNTCGGANSDNPQPLLELVCVAACETKAAAIAMDARANAALIDEQCRVARLLLEAGADWSGLDQFLVDGARHLPQRMSRLLQEERDDISPFCKALVSGDEEAALRWLSTVADFERVPSRYAREKWSYFHIAVVNGMTRLVQSMLLESEQRDEEREQQHQQQSSSAPRTLNINARDANDRSALHLALQKCADAGQRRLIVEALLAHGANPNQPCTYSKLIGGIRSFLDKQKKRSSSGGGGATSTRLPDTGAALLQKVSAESVTYGTPLAQAEAMQATDLTRRMRSRRYLRVSVDSRDKDAYGAPLLQDYIVQCISLHTGVARLLQSGSLTEQHSLHRLYVVYGDVFHCFNPHFADAAGYGERVLDRIYAHAGVQDRHQDESADKSLASRLDVDQSVLAQHVVSSGAVPGASGTVNELRCVAQLLMQATDAMRDHWFDRLSSVIERSARRLYARAALDVLRRSIAENAVARVAYMLADADRFGVARATIVDQHLGMRTIELAVHSGASAVIDLLLRRDPTLADTAHQTRGSLVQIARVAAQPISIVALDHWRHNLSGGGRTHAVHYDAISETSGTVLHECVRQQRADLLEFCLPALQPNLVQRKTARGETAVQIARTLLGVQAISVECSTALRRCIELLEAASSSVGTPRRA